MKTGTKVLVYIAMCVVYGVLSAILAATGVKMGGLSTLLLFGACMWVAFIITNY